MSTDLCHEEYLVPPAFQALAHPVFRLAAVIFPAVVEERDSAVDGLVTNLHGCSFVLRVPKMMTAQAKSRNLDVGLGAEASQRDRVDHVPWFD